MPKKGENNQELVMIITTSLQADHSESRRENNQGQMVFFQSEAMNNDEPIPDVDDQSEIYEYEGFLDLDFMAQTVVPLSVVYP